MLHCEGPASHEMRCCELSSPDVNPIFNCRMSVKPGAGSIKDLQQKKREVFKPILDNPFTKGLEWPSIEKSVSEKIIESLGHVLSGYGKYLEANKGKGGNGEQPEESVKITLGFNSAVQRLEDQAAPNRAKILGRKFKEKESKASYVKYVFVAKSDIVPELLTSCFPLLTFSASRSLQDRVKLVQLPKGSMGKLLRILRTSNVGIITFTDDWAPGKPVFDLVDQNVEDVPVPWLEGIFDENTLLDGVYVKPQIKFLKTQVPVGHTKKKAKGAAQKQSQPKRRNEVDNGEGSKKPKLG